MQIPEKATILESQIDNWTSNWANLRAKSMDINGHEYMRLQSWRAH